MYPDSQQQPPVETPAETPITTQSEHPNEHPEEKAAHNIADKKLIDAATNAKHTLLQQINTFN